MSDLRAARLHGLMAGLFPGCAIGAGAVPIGEGGPLWPGETAGETRVVPQRLAEFIAGRAAVRAAMVALGLPQVAVPRGRDRAPVWPEGLVGSLSHADGMAVAVVARTGGDAPGIDIEPDAALPGALMGAILRPEEQAWANSQPDPGLAARLIFVAKEAGYKAQYSFSRAFIGFQEARFEMEGEMTTEGGAFCLTIQRPFLPEGTARVLQGRWSRGAGLLIAGVLASDQRGAGACSGVA